MLSKIHDYFYFCFFCLLVCFFFCFFFVLFVRTVLMHNFHFKFISFYLQTDAITENILDVASKFLGANKELLTKSNEKSNTSSTFLRSLDTIAIYVTRQSTRQRKVFKKENIALAIENNSKSFTLIAKQKTTYWKYKVLTMKQKVKRLSLSFLYHSLSWQE